MNVQYIFAVFFVIIAVLVLAVIISADVKKSVGYLKSNRATGLIVEKTGERSMSAYGTQRRRCYSTYHVRCTIHRRELVLEAASKRRDLAPGNILIVRYVEYPDGRICEVFPYEWDRLRELLVGSVLGIAVAAACIFYKLSEG